MKIKSQKDFVSGWMFVLLGLAFATGALAYPFGSAAQPGPGVLPFALGLLLALLGSLVLFTALTFETDAGDLIGPIAWRPLLSVLGALAVFVATLAVLGLVLSVVLFLLVLSLALRRPRWREVLLGGLMLTLLAWAFFAASQKLPLPIWPHGLLG